MSKPLDLIEVMARAIYARHTPYPFEDAYKAVRSRCINDATAALAALEKEGHVVVPVAPVAELQAGFDQAMRASREIAYEGPEIEEMWPFLIAAVRGRPVPGISHPQAVYTPEPPKA